jgi:hypothetical protein
MIFDHSSVVDHFFMLLWEVLGKFDKSHGEVSFQSLLFVSHTFIPGLKRFAPCEGL